MEFLLYPIGIAVALAVSAFFIKNVILKTVLSLLFVLDIAFLHLFALFFLPSVIGVHAVWFSFFSFVVVSVDAMVLVWRPWTKKRRAAVALSLVGALIISGAVFAGPEIYRRGLPVAPDEEELNLTSYEPFDYTSSDVIPYLTKSLDGESTLKLKDNLPRLDGATALYPLYSAYVRATYPKDDYAWHTDLRAPDSELSGSGSGSGSGAVACSRTDQAFENLIDGYADIAFLMGVSDEQRARAETKKLGLTLTPIGREAFVFFVNKSNSVENLSVEDVRRIYSGDATDWRDVGGGSANIRAYQRPEGSGSQTALTRIMEGVSLAPALEDDIFETMMGMYRRVSSYRNYKNSLGYSFMFYINGMIGENQVKLLSIDGVSPTRDNIANGAYPYAQDFFAVTARSDVQYLNPGRSENIDALIEWILSPQGQSLVDATGYVPIAP